MGNRFSKIKNNSLFADSELLSVLKLLRRICQFTLDNYMFMHKAALFLKKLNGLVLFIQMK